jgi:CRISPR-associated protein Cmr6
MSQIPITRDYAAAAGDCCEKVENRSLLLDKFALPKNWGEAVKENAAASWSLMRIASNGAVLKLDTLRQKHTARFLELLRAAYPENRLAIVNARLEGRLAINLAEGVIQNAGISLDRVFGLPLIPGSAIKGVARHAAWLDAQAHPEKQCLLNRVFGADDSGKQGAVSFLQAAPTNTAQIVVDITNVHTPDYYHMGREADLAKETPKPNTFPAVERGAEFAFPIILNGLDPAPALLEAARDWLLAALTQNGIGARTAAGYGWFSDITAEVAEREREATATRARRDEKNRLLEERKAREEAELAKRREEKAAAADFAKLAPSAQLAAIAADNGQFRQFLEKRFATLTPDEKAGVVCWFASADGNARWLEIRDAAGKGKKPWSQIVPQIHAAKKTANLKLP